jgi:hypothetical protein
MQSVNNLGIIDYCCNCAHGLVGKAAFSYDATAKTITITDESVVTAPEVFKILHADVYDRFGNKRYGKITTAAGNVVVSTAAIAAGPGVLAQPAMDPSRGFAVAITVVTATGHAKDGTAFNIASSRNAGEFDVEK